MIKSELYILYIGLINTIGFHRSKKHLAFIRQFGESHHLFGSFSQSLKTSDYCTIPVTREEHQRAEKDKSAFAIANLGKLIKYLILRIEELEKKK